MENHQRRVYFINILCWTILSIQFLSVSSKAAKRPNVVFILADDYGFRDIGYHGAEFPTPNLDKLAAKGVKLENYYVQPICSPTRSQLMTGRYQIHTGLQHSIIWPSQPFGLPVKFPTIANVLQEAGYSTHAIGKWHLGIYKKEHTPLHRGFDTFYGYWLGGEQYFTYHACDGFHNRTVGDDEREPLSDTKLNGFGHKDSTNGWCGYDLRDMEEPVTNMNGTYSTHLYTRKAIEVMQTAKKQDKPFFLYLAYQAVHNPMQCPPEYVKPFDYIQDNYRRIYAGMTKAMDEGVGNVTRAMQELGLEENTIIIFSTDNGGATNSGGYNWPLRGFKMTLWEGGMRGIGFVTSPLLKQQGTVSKQLMHVSDWFPTIADIAGVKLNTSLNLDGMNQWPMINNGKSSPRKEILHNIDIWQPLKGEMLFNDTFDTRVRAAIRVGDYKLVTGDPGDGGWYPPPHMKHLQKNNPHTFDDKKNLWLFNIKDDPTESIDLSGSKPDLVQVMLDRLKVYNATAVPPMYPQSDPNCNPQLHGGYWGPWQ